MRALLLACALALVAASTAAAGTVSGRTFDPNRDTVDCGAGHDRAYVSRNDRVTGCETVIYGSPD